MDTIIKVIVALGVVLAIFAVGSFVAGRFLGQDTGLLVDVQSQNEKLRKDLTSAQSEITKLKQVNAGLQADMAGGRDVEEQREALETRSKELDRREAELAVAENNYTERDATLRQEELEFYEATNLTQQDIGQAKQIQHEYEAMRRERDDARGLADRWLMFIWGISIFAFLLLLAFVVIIMRYWSTTARYRAETQQRQQAVQLLAATLGSSVTTEQRDIIVSTMSGYAAPPFQAQRL